MDGTAAGLPAGCDDALVRATEDELPEGPLATCLLSISVVGRARRGGLARDLIVETVARATRAGHLAVVGPLRPTRKGAEPSPPG